MFTVLRKGFLILLAIVLIGLITGIALGADALFGKALRAWGPYAFGGQPVKFADSELSVFGGRANVTDFHAGTEAKPLLDLERGALEVSIGAALAGRVHIREATLTGARLHFIVEKDGTLAVDPGPPPEKERAKKPPPARETPLPKAENRDVIQIMGEYWDRYQQYKEYYDKYGGVFAGGDGEAEEKTAPARFPGKPDFVADAQARAREERDALGVFYLESAAIEDFGWETVDRRTGAPILPELKSFTFALERLGTAPVGMLEPATIRGEGSFASGGSLQFRLDLSRTAEPSALDFSALGIQVDEIADLSKMSLPFKVAGGIMDLKTAALRFASDSLSGTVSVELRGARVTAKKNAPPVLGVEPQEFCKLLNQALAAGPVAFSIVLGGTPTSPQFDVENEMDLGDLLGGAVKAEVTRRANELMDEKKGELQGKLEKEAKEKLGDKAGGLLDGVLGDKPKKPKH